jgi:hypothetical protein
LILDSRFDAVASPLKERLPMSRMSRWLRVMVLVVVTAVAWGQPEEASAWFGRCYRGFYGGGFYGAGFRPWCGPRFYGGWGGWYGGTRVFYSNSVYLGGPWGGFYSGSIGPRWCGPFWGGGFGLPCTYYPVAYPAWCGYGVGYSPIVVSPYGGSIAPVYGPAGVLPYMGFAANASSPAQALTAAPTAIAAAAPAPRFPAAQAAGQTAPVLARLAALRGATPATIAVRASNGEARLRAARLVAVGDRHLRAAVDNPAKLTAALDAYRRAATIAPDQADTHLRQAIALSALDRGDDAARAVDRAVAIDARLGQEPAAAVAARGTLPPDPVFGDRPDAGPTTLASRSRDLLARIFTDRDRPAGAGNANWIAARWTRDVGGPAAGQVEAIAAR